ncbi:hypothetical protein DRO97_02435 [Archaeoglobales archaeon]|nr:MAG: hypothetical protein DRO97_02435 [Archaeoglobales archaeon]
MGIYLGGKHEEDIDRVLEFLQYYLDKVKSVKLSKMHTVYFALKFTMLGILEKDEKDWEVVFDEVRQEIQMDGLEFTRNVDRLLDEFKKDIAEKIKKGELI